MRIIIIGAGRIGERHAKHISDIGELVAVCDIDRKRGLLLSEQYQAEYFPSLADLLEANLNADVIAVCTPNGLHAEHTVLCLNAGYNVLCEKPMALSVEECLSMIKAAEQADKKLFIVKQNRFNPPVVAVKELLEREKLGNIYSVQLSCFWNRNENYYQDSWRGTKQLDGGILFTQFSHFIDLLLWLIGDISELQTMLGNVANRNDIEFEDSCVVNCRFANGALGSLNFTINSFEKNMEGSLTIFGEKGTVKIGGEYLNLLEYQSIQGAQVENLPLGNPANNYGGYTGSMSNHKAVYQNVKDVLENNAVQAVNGEDGLKTVDLIQRIYSANID